jgi:hypothetical protein
MNDLAEWQRFMRAGDFEAAWRISDRHPHGTLDPDRVVVRCDPARGLGDAIQFIRLVPLIPAREVIVSAPERLIPLLERVRGVDRVVALTEEGVELMDLPYLLRLTVDTIPNEVPYLDVDPLPLPPGFHVGLMWQSSGWDRRRDIPPELFRFPEGVTVHSLQRDEHGPTATPLGTARLVRALDLVISIDSFAAHLAGALAVPVWTLLHADPDWRWLEGRDESPWYPTMRLFHQKKAGDWCTVLEAVATELCYLPSVNSDQS